MEVHHHSHTARKKIAHYFWEFFMLFLAVVAGFLVENQREHYIEHLRAKQYARALLSDLISDTATLSNNINAIGEVISSQEKMLGLMANSDKVPGATLYHYASLAEAGTFFSVKTATLDQLKNSGSLRYFKSFELVKLINEYDQALTNQFARAEVDQAYATEYRQAYKEIFSFEGDNKVNQLLFIYPQSQDSILQLNIPLLPHDRKQHSNYMHALENRKYNLSHRIQKYYSEPLDAAKLLITALKKEYRFK
jgi:hypothetical protein